MDFLKKFFYKFVDFVRGPEELDYDEYDDIDDYIDEEKGAIVSSIRRNEKLNEMMEIEKGELGASNIINIENTRNDEITFFTPKFSSDAKEILMSLKYGKLGIVRLDSLNSEDRREVFENIKGACIITDGHIKKLDEYIYMVVPKNTKLILENGEASKKTDNEPSFEIRVFEPSKYDDVKMIVEYFKDYKPVVLKLGNLDENIKTRVFEFVNGSVFTLEGKSKLLIDDILLLGPKNVKVNISPLIKANNQDENVRTEKISNVIFKI